MLSPPLAVALVALGSAVPALPGGASTVPSVPEVTCPVGQLAGPGAEHGDRTCYSHASGDIPPLDQPIELTTSSASDDGAVEYWCVRRDDGTDGWAGPHRVPCHFDGWWYTPLWDCFIRVGEPEIGVEPPRWDVGGDEEGRLWRVQCYPPQEDPDGDLMWLPPPPQGGLWRSSMLVLGPAEPPGWLGTPSLVPGLWVEAINSLRLRGPEIATAPPLDAAGLVRLPTWVWTENTARTWPEAPLHARADARPEGVDSWVDAWAQPARIEWDMGDGLPPTVCEHPGVAWQPGMDDDQGHGECSHRYLRPSRDQPDGFYEITAVTTWQVRWEVNGGADRGELEIQVGSTAPYRVNEVQVLVGYR